MTTMIFLEEYTSKTRTAHLFQREVEKDYVVVQHEGASTIESEPFTLESEAETFAQDWVVGSSEIQPASDSASCCDGAGV